MDYHRELGFATNDFIFYVFNYYYLFIYLYFWKIDLSIRTFYELLI